jgi:hypothetical protein
MTHAEQLERETEQARAEIANTLDELRSRMTPGHVLDQLTDRINTGATAAFARNLRDQAVNNPLPVALISTGLAWLMLGRRGASDVGEMADSQTADTLRDTADPARQAAGQAADTIQDGAGAVGETMRRTAAATRTAGQRTLQSGSALIDVCREQPLVLAGLGIAMGAIIGALLPASEAAKESAQQAAEPIFDTSQEEAAHPKVAHPATGEQKAADWKDDAKEGSSEPGADEPTLAPKGPDETKGQPWSPENAPL